MTLSSRQPPEGAAQSARIADIPRLAQTLRQIEGMTTFKAALPFEKPFLRLLKIDANRIEASLQNLEQLRADIKDLHQLPDASTSQPF